MPHYYFSTKHGTQHTDYGEALELVNDRAAWEEATVACGEILKDIDGKLKPNRNGGWTSRMKAARSYSAFV
jgi:hypothetical protein